MCVWLWLGVCIIWCFSESHYSVYPKNQVRSNTATKVDRTASIVVTPIATVIVVRMFIRDSRLFILNLIFSIIPSSLATRPSIAISYRSHEASLGPQGCPYFPLQVTQDSLDAPVYLLGGQSTLG